MCAHPFPAFIAVHVYDSTFNACTDITGVLGWNRNKRINGCLFVFFVWKLWGGLSTTEDLQRPQDIGGSELFLRTEQVILERIKNSSDDGGGIDGDTMLRLFCVIFHITTFKLR